MLHGLWQAGGGETTSVPTGGRVGGAFPCRRRYRRPDWEPVHTPPAPAAQRLPGAPVRAEATLELGSALCLDRALARRAMTCADTSSCSRGSPSNKHREAPRSPPGCLARLHLRQEGPSPAGRAPCAWPWGQESGHARHRPRRGRRRLPSQATAGTTTGTDGPLPQPEPRAAPAVLLSAQRPLGQRKRPGRGAPPLPASPARLPDKG